MTGALIGVYLTIAYLVAHLALRRIGDRGQRALDAKQPERRKICPLDSPPLFSSTYELSRAHQHTAECYVEVLRITPYTRTGRDIAVAVVAGLAWVVTLLILSFDYAPRSSAERAAQAKLDTRQAEARLKQLEDEYQRLIGDRSEANEMFRKLADPSAKPPVGTSWVRMTDS